MKTSFCVCVIFSTCFLTGIVLVFGSSDSEFDPSENPSPIPSPAEYLESLAKYFKGLEERNRELEKSQEEFRDLKSIHQKTLEEFRDLKANYEKSHAELKDEFKLLKGEMYKLKNDMRDDHGVWLLTPRLRGPPGKDGKQGEKGPTGEKGATGQPGSTGNPGATGSRGEKGERGEVGPPGPKGDRGISAVDPRLTSCSDAMEILPSPRSTKQSIYAHANNKSLEVLCDFESDDGGWVVIQKRSSGPREEFNKTWNEYANGFGSLDRNFWIGLENIHALTKNGDQELRIQLEDFEGNQRFAKYSTFSISDASDFYRLSIEGFSGDATDSMIQHNGSRFYTKDKNDSGNCAKYYSSGWWFYGCFYSNLNGLYRVKGETFSPPHGIHWYTWTEYSKSLSKTEMKIRRKKSP